MDKIIEIFKKLDPSNYTNFIFSIGVYNNWDQVFSIYKKNSVIFAIDSLYGQSKHMEFFEYKYQTFIFDKNLGGYVNKKDDITLYIIPYNLSSDCKIDDEIRTSYLFSFSCLPKNDAWKHFFILLQGLIRQDKYIYINNRAFYNTNTFIETEGKVKRVSYNRGLYFEFFPELGFLLNVLYQMHPNARICIYTGRRFVEISKIAEFGKPNPAKDGWLNGFSKTQKKTLEISPPKLFRNEKSIIQYIRLAQSEHRIHKISMSKDDSCLFHCFAHYLKTEPQLVRQAIVDYERKHMKQRITPILKQSRARTFEQYLEKMKKYNTWGGDPEISAFVERFGFNVAIIDRNTDNIIIFMNPAQQPSPTIFLYYVNGNHYDIASITRNSQKKLLIK